HPRVPYLFSMYTEPGFRGRGLASRIVREAIRLSRRRGYTRVVLHAAPLGRRVYSRLGFERSWEMRLLLAH
ncbi:MAG TPA: GNAT family N-acetyltransferase, partial [Thermoplasmata archaeon]|nr:GNAT family N-acetyltransferase [Thermoplasmata archaeon]